MSTYNDSVIAEFRANEGKVGGHWEGRDLLLLTTQGRKSGRARTTPVVYTRSGDRFVVFASNGGSRDDPEWFKNLRANPNVTVEVGTETFDATATPLAGAERDRLWDEHVREAPRFAEYATAAAPRAIPVVALVRR